MNATRGIVGMIGVIIWIMISDFAGGISGLAAGWMAMACLEPMAGDLSGCLLLLTVPLGLCAGGLLGVACLGWVAASHLFDSRPALAGG